MKPESTALYACYTTLRSIANSIKTMSDEGGSTTHAPPPSYGRVGNSTNNGGGGLSIVSSSQLSPKSPAPWDRDGGSRTVLVSEHNSWGEPGEERMDRRRRSTVTFGGATEVAPSSSISKRGPRPSRDTQKSSGPATQYTRRRSAPGQNVEYRSGRPSKVGSSQGGAGSGSRGAPLTEQNVEVFNEKRPPRSEGSAERAVERDVGVTEVELDPKVSKKSPRDSGIVTQAPQTEARSAGAATRRTSKRYSQAGYESDPALARRPSAMKRSGNQRCVPHFRPQFPDEASYLGSNAPDLETKNRRHHREFRERRDGYESAEGEMLRNSNPSREYVDGGKGRGRMGTMVTAQQRTEVEEDGSLNEDVRTESKSRYESYRRPTQSSASKVSERRQSRAADVYAKSAGRRESNSSAARWNAESGTAPTQRSRPPTMPPESREDVRSSKALALVPVNTTSGSRVGGRSRAATDTNGAGNEEYSHQTEVESEHFSSHREAETEQKSTAISASRAGQSARRSTVPSRPSQPAGAATATSPTEPSQSPQSAGPPSAPGPMTESPEPQWERRLHIVETRQPDGRLIQDREYSMRRIWPQVGA